MTIKTHLYDQFREPRGPLGVLAGRIMSKRSSNRERSAWTVDLLDVQPDDRILELGYGPGLGLEAALGPPVDRTTRRTRPLDDHAQHGRPPTPLRSQPSAARSPRRQRGGAPA